MRAQPEVRGLAEGQQFYPQASSAKTRNSHNKTCLPTYRGQSSSVSWLGVGLVISRSLVQFPARALFVCPWASLFHIASVYPSAKWVPSINKAMHRACALYAASCSGISPGGLKWFPCVEAC